MPLYEYQCDACSNRFERIQKFSDPPVDACPSCGGKVRKLLSSPAIQFKGSGWYVTDYSSKGKAAEKSDSATASDGDKKDAGSEKKSDKAKESSPAKKGSEPASTKSPSGD